MKTARIFIPSSTKNSIGGPTSFLSNITEYAARNQISLSNSPLESDIIFFPVAFDLKTLIQAKAKKIKIVQRLDGLYYPARNGYSAYLKNLKISLIYNFFSGYKIFQSQNSKNQCDQIFRPTSKTILPTIAEKKIYNGADKTVFFPSSDANALTLSKNQVVKFVTVGSFRHLDMLAPIIEALDHLKFPFEFHIVGPITHPKLSLWLDRGYIKCHGPQNREATAAILRSGHVFLFSSLNSACPNALIEAIATGLPAISYDTGAARELLSFAPEQLVPTSDQLFTSATDLSSQRFLDSILLALDQYQNFKQRALDHHQLFTLDEMGRQYFNFFEEILSQ